MESLEKPRSSQSLAVLTEERVGAVCSAPGQKAGRKYISKGLALLPSLLHRRAEFEVFKPIYFCM